MIEPSVLALLFKSEGGRCLIHVGREGFDDPRLPGAVRALRAEVGAADVLLISTPEYAHGVPGSLKNALDWLVGSAEFPGKRVALLNASGVAKHAQASLIETLTTMSADLVSGSPFVAPILKGHERSARADDPLLQSALSTLWAQIVAAGTR